MPNGNKTSEAELSEVVLQILAGRKSGEASFNELIAEIPNRISLKSGDRLPSQTRSGEDIWEQRVRNITSHKDANGNFINEGYIESIPGGLRITDAGRKKVGS